ncbi:peptidoglycan D,D-transpeptidase FtsI family protein [Corynebacterium epidermidicanis]|uniref:Cell division protein FtsI/penicillin-binding protein 2 n=1 Tax=Corynebacterium epidermidicanis TaxID=1050174 RepID=A0A0G3GXD2_9CORY|nr:penicillin-binding protein 2 [Corynebacterium epidermidicanis]AKK03527.1 cell division protein FtsI/penicillin-binding protein 2 [Corynebacterium epidermidicanis]
MRPDGPAVPKTSREKKRFKFARGLAVAASIALVARLGWVQVVWGPEFSAKAQEQRARVYVDPARRGEITDRNGSPLAYTMQARSLTVSPQRLRMEIKERARQQLAIDGKLAAIPQEQRDAVLEQMLQDKLEEMAQEIPKAIEAAGASRSKVNSDDLKTKLRADTHYEVLVRNVDPDVAADVAKRFPGVAADHQDIRQYPNGAVGENVVGKISMDGEGQFGLEAAQDALLAGVDGRVTQDVSANGQAIPGTLRDDIPVTNGAGIELTLDLNLQTYVQQQLEQAKANSKAKSAAAVVLDAKTGEVLAMANTDTVDPTGDVSKQVERGKSFDNPAVTHPFEPGSVAKIITAAAAIEGKLTTPDEVLQVPGSINMSGVNVRDAWSHGTVGYTTTGVFGKSSNVGTLMLAQRVGEDTFASYLEKFGIGKATGIELPSETQGLLPARSQWSGGTFANLPIGQGMSMSLLQMTSIYQTLANGGTRIEPRIIKKVTGPDGGELRQPEPQKTQVVSPETARTVVDMFRSVTQKDPTGVQSGTGAGAGIEGYQVSGKTGTAQKVDPVTQAYSNDKYWITFAGIAPADNPRFVIGIVLDEPQRGVHGEGGQSAAPLFHDIGAWLLNRDNVPLSPPQEGQLVLQAN